MPTRRVFLYGLAAAPLPLFSATSGVQAQTLASGPFTGASGHTASGTGSLVTQDGATFVSLGRDFRFDGAPDPKIALGRGGVDKSTILAPLASDSGAQSYRLPDGLDAAAYDEIWIWCEQYDVPLGSAKLSR